MNLSNEYVEHIKKEGIEYLQFKILQKYSDKISHAYYLGLDLDFTTVIQGKPAPISRYENGIKSYKILCDGLGEEYDNVVKTTQTHTDKVEKVTEKINKTGPDINVDKYQDVDGLITDKKNLILSTTNADCILLMFYDPIKNVIGNSHSGWKGTLQRISVKTVKKMIEEYGCDPKDLICVMSPSIRKDHFEVSKDVKDSFEKEFKDIENINELIVETTPGKKWNIDTIEINRQILKILGLKEENIVDSGICSVCNKEIIHSYRAEGQKYGLTTAVIKLK